MKYSRALPSAATLVVLVSSLVVSDTVSAAVKCLPRPLNETKPTLSGVVEDQSRNLGLSWHSAAGNNQTGGWWIIDNSICNTGGVPLVLDWPKASLGNDAYSPLLPGKEMHNEFSAGSQEPAPGDAPLSYGGYVASSTETRIYQAPISPQKTGASLRSSISGTFARYDSTMPTDSIQIAPVDVIDLQVQVTPVSEGYRFAITFKSATPADFNFAISSGQNRAFVAALEKAGVKNPGIIPLRKMISERPGRSAFTGLLDRPFVVMPVVNDKTPLDLFIPSKATEVEVATVVLLRGYNIPVMVGKVSLLQ